MEANLASRGPVSVNQKCCAVPFCLMLIVDVLPNAFNADHLRLHFPPVTSDFAQEAGELKKGGVGTCCTREKHACRLTVQPLLITRAKAPKLKRPSSARRMAMRMKVNTAMSVRRSKHAWIHLRTTVDFS